MSKKILGMWMAFMAILVLGLSQAAFALGTTAGTSVENRATIDYKVGGNDQTPIESSATGNSTPGAGAGSDTTFLVDNKVDLTVAEQITTYVDVTPNQQDAYLTFTVTNEGNYVQDYTLAAAAGADPFGGTDNFDATGLVVFVESGVTAGYQAGEDTATFIDELAPDASVTVYIVGDIPVVQVNGDISAISLTATTHDGGATGSQGALTANDEGAADDPATVQVVFADAAGDTDGQYSGSHSDTGAFKVASAALTVAKTSDVISDPVNGVSADAKAIPGAVIEYTITVSNAAGSGNTATAIQVTDSLATEITAGTLAFNADTYGSGEGIQVTAPNINGGSALDLTNTADADQGAWAADTVTVTGIDLAPGESATVTFQVTVQ